MSLNNFITKLVNENNLSYKVELGSDSSSNITCIDNDLNSIGFRLSNVENNLEDTKKNFENAKIEINKPFSKGEELKQNLYLERYG